MTNKRLSTKGVAVLLSRSPHWVHMNAKRLGIPRYRLGGAWVYDEIEVLHWFKQQKEEQSESRSGRSREMRIAL
jgi:hypothetical protein